MVLGLIAMFTVDVPLNQTNDFMILHVTSTSYIMLTVSKMAHDDLQPDGGKVRGHPAMYCRSGR